MDIFKELNENGFFNRALVDEIETLWKNSLHDSLKNTTGDDREASFQGLVEALNTIILRNDRNDIVSIMRTSHVKKDPYFRVHGMDHYVRVDEEGKIMYTENDSMAELTDRAIEVVKGMKIVPSLSYDVATTIFIEGIKTSDMKFMYKLWHKFTSVICQKWAKYIKDVDISFLEELFLYFEEVDMISMVVLAERTDYLDGLKDHSKAFGAAFRYRVRSMLVYIVEKLGFTINYATALNIVRFDYDMLAPHIVPHIDKNMIGLMASLPHSETYVKLVPFKIRYADYNLNLESWKKLARLIHPDDYDIIVGKLRLFLHIMGSLSPEELKVAIDAGADITTPDYRGYPPICFASPAQINLFGAINSVGGLQPMKRLSWTRYDIQNQMWLNELLPMKHLEKIVVESAEDIEKLEILKYKRGLSANLEIIDKHRKFNPRYRYKEAAIIRTLIMCNTVYKVLLPNEMLFEIFAHLVELRYQYY